MPEKNQCREEITYEPLPCELCGADLLGAALGNCVYAQTLDWAATPRYVNIYCVCKGRCDKLIQATLRNKGYSAPWKGVDELKNPLEHRRWTKGTLRLIERGEFSGTAVAKASNVVMTTAPSASREPTEQDIIRFRQLRWFDGL